MSDFSVPNTRAEVRRLLALALPVVIGHLGGMLMGVVDTAMMGRVGAADLAAATLGHIVLMAVTFPMMGVLMGSDPLMSQAFGARKPERIALFAQRTIVLVPLLMVPVVGVAFAGPWLLGLLGQPADVIPLADSYVKIGLLGVPCFLGFHIARQYLQVRGIVRQAMWVMLLANVLNALGNWVLIFGNLGAPALGLEGSAWTTATVRCVMLVWLVAWIRRDGLHVGFWRRWDRSSFEGLGRIVRLGVPIAIGLAVEVWAFQASSLLAGQLGEHALAAHSIVFTVVSLVFMVPLGISIASSIRVGNLIGAGDPAGAQRTAHVALGLGAAFMGTMSLAFLAGGDGLAHLFTDEPALLALAVGLFPIAAAFQVFDGAQTICAGILRGMGQTTLPAVAHGLGFYVLGLPAAWVMLRVGEAELREIWWGLCLGLVVVSGVLVTRVLRRGPRFSVALGEEASISPTSSDT